MPAREKPMSERLSSAVDGATTVKTSPAAKSVVVVDVNVAVAALAEKFMVAKDVPFLLIENEAAAFAAVTATPYPHPTSTGSERRREHSKPSQMQEPRFLCL
jgi:translation elongation factor EF-Ts